KTMSGFRTVLLPKHTIMTLQELQLVHPGLLNQPGSSYNDLGIVFSSRTGGYADGHNITKRTMKSICKRAGLPPMRFHDLRHSHGSLLAANSLSARTISDRLGHSDASFTMKAYTHRTSFAQLAVINVLDAILIDEK
ncbi:MAG TPA: tyrosine-type recombinase/integrase, partial [Bacillota bacterium]|nr:tyrosine-type recombinase/integrase [Bacillota bacterium]